LTDEGVGCDTFGETELDLALRSRVEPGLISVNGASKGQRPFRRGVQAGARITLGSAREVDVVEAISRELGRDAENGPPT
jgi:diaminopimelate decarboxylase